MMNEESQQKNKIPETLKNNTADIPEQKNYRNILKSTSLIGSASMINILIGMVRTKFIAILLGPSGVGLIGMLTSITSMVSMFSGMGINTSGVRSIAEQYGKNNPVQMSQVIQSLRKTVWFTGLLGTLLLIFASPILSFWTFHNYDYTISVAALGITILFSNIAVGQSCVIQGTRRITDLAKLQILGAFNSTVIAIPLYYIFGINGIVPSLILGSIATLVTSWYYARHVEIVPCNVSWKQTLAITYQLLTFGLPIMLIGLMGTFFTYFFRTILLNRFDLQGIGIYTAAYAISGILVDFVLNAMTVDYYPRLISVANDHEKVKSEVDTQSEITLLLAVPALMITIIFAPLVIWLFYSSEFGIAVDILRWMVFGIFSRVVAWPLGFVTLAKGKGKIFFISEFIYQIFHLTAILLCTSVWGLIGTGIAFVFYYFFYTFFMLLVYYLLTKNTWRLSYCLQVLLFLSLLIIVDLIMINIKMIWLNWTFGILILIVTTMLCLWRLSKKTGINISTLKQKIFKRLNRNE